MIENLEKMDINDLEFMAVRQKITGNILAIYEDIYFYEVKNQLEMDNILSSGAILVSSKQEFESAIKNPLAKEILVSGAPDLQIEEAKKALRFISNRKTIFWQINKLRG